jgi:Spy/CpxP family protein refolding chaperone
MISSHRTRFLLAIVLAAPLAFAAPAARSQAQDNNSPNAGAGQNQGPGPGSGPGPGQGQGQGQGRGGRGPMSPDDRLKQMTSDLNLTADQQAKIKPILADQQKKMDDARNDNSGGDWQAMRQKMDQIRTDTDQKIRVLLDDNQKTKFDQEEQQREQRMQHRGGGMGGPGNGPDNGPNNGPNNGPDNGPNNGPGNGANTPPPTN